MKCHKCKTEMEDGIAIENTLTGIPDFIGDTHCVTVSPGGPGKVISCFKCRSCGHSVYPFIPIEPKIITTPEANTEPTVDPVTLHLAPSQISALKCAYADLVGALQCYENCDMHSHDWKAHALSIQELESAFTFLNPEEG